MNHIDDSIKAGIEHLTSTIKDVASQAFIDGKMSGGLFKDVVRGVLEIENRIAGVPIPAVKALPPAPTTSSAPRAKFDVEGALRRLHTATGAIRFQFGHARGLLSDLNEYQVYSVLRNGVQRGLIVRMGRFAGTRYRFANGHAESAEG